MNKLLPVAIERSAATMLLSQNMAHEMLETLTPREFEVGDAVVMGLTNKEIGRHLGMSPRTAEVHRARIMTKLNIRCIPDLVRFFLFAQHKSKIRIAQIDTIERISSAVAAAEAEPKSSQLRDNDEFLVFLLARAPRDSRLPVPKRR